MPAEQPPFTGRTSILRAGSRVAQPWRNGGGITFPVAVEPAEADAGGAFDWRVSIAEIATDGGFSEFAGVDRQITIMAGAGLDLTIDGVATALRPGVVVPFRGESTVSARLVDGPTLDLNLMTTRSRASGRLRVEPVGAAGLELVPVADTTILVVITGPVLFDGTSLNPLDAGRLGAGSVRVTAAAEAWVAVIEIDAIGPPF